MTPEERAEHLVAAVYAEGFDRRPLVEIMAAEIRAAENDALERAALKLEAEITPETADEEVFHDSAYEHAAGVVRSLKHPEV